VLLVFKFNKNPLKIARQLWPAISWSKPTPTYRQSCKFLFSPPSFISPYPHQTISTNLVSSLTGQTPLNVYVNWHTLNSAMRQLWHSWKADTRMDPSQLNKHARGTINADFPAILQLSASKAAKTRHAGQLDDGSYQLAISCWSFPSLAMRAHHQRWGTLNRILFCQSISDCADELDRCLFGSKWAPISLALIKSWRKMQRAPERQNDTWRWSQLDFIISWSAEALCRWRLEGGFRRSGCLA